MQQAVEGEDEVMRGHRRAVRPFPLGLKVEHPAGHVLVVFPGCRRTGCGRVVPRRIVRDQSLEQGRDDLALDHAGHQLMVQRLGFRGIPHQQNPFPSRPIHLRLPLAGSYKHQERGVNQEQAAERHAEEHDVRTRKCRRNFRKSLSLAGKSGILCLHDPGS